MLQNGSLCGTNGGKIFHVNKTTILMDFNLFFSVINLFTSAPWSTYRSGVHPWFLIGFVLLNL